MASIYANAYFTIVSAAGNYADYGLCGVEGVTEARNAKRDIIRFGNGKEMLIFSSESQEVEKSSWASRGWTFQEDIFSRRTLYFNGLTAWLCRRTFWQEHIHRPSESVAYAAIREPSSFRKSMQAQNATWPNLDEWDRLVCQFNKRKLTYDEDVLHAFAGVTSTFNSGFHGGILWGIPELFFDYCIVWRPLGLLRRRRAHLSPGNTIPSWSWAGWEGEISLVGAPIILTNEPRLDFQSISLVPAVRWYKSGKSSSGISPVGNIYHRLQHASLDKRSEKLPKGWTHGLYAEGAPYYVHNTVPSVRFRYPIPLVNKNVRASLDDQGQHLLFRVQRAWLFVGREIPPASKHWTSCAACLVDNSNNWAGSIRLNIAKSIGPPLGQTCELVALSVGIATNSGNYHGVLDEWDLPERPRDSDFYSFYYVMWIEWENGIAYRKAIGTVYKSVWEREIKDSIDVILG